nr:P1 [Mus sp.]
HCLGKWLGHPDKF